MWGTNLAGQSSDSDVSHVEISSKPRDHSQIDYLCSNHMKTYQASPDPSFPVCDTESDPRWSWFGPACKTNVDLIQCKERAEPFHTRTANEQILNSDHL